MRLPRPRFALSAALLLCLSGCVSELDSGAYGSMDDPRNAQMLDLVDQALKGNMAVVLVADVMPHKSLSDALTMTQWTPTAIWEYEKDPKVTFGRKFQTNALQRKPDETYLFKAFEVHILPPGKYLLTGGDDYQIHGLLDQVGARGGPPGSGHGANGTAYLSPELYREYYREEVWKDATYGSEIKTEKVCTAVHVASGACVSWGEQQYTQTTQGSQAGYYQQTDSPRRTFDQDPGTLAGRQGAGQLQRAGRAIAAGPAHAPEDPRLQVPAVEVPGDRSEEDRMPIGKPDRLHLAGADGLQPVPDRPAGPERQAPATAVQAPAPADQHRCASRAWKTRSGACRCH